MKRQYKNSGIPWIKQIPSDWNIIRGKNLLHLMNRPVREDDDVVTCFRDGEVILRSERRTEGFTMSDKEIGYQGINRGDIVIHGMDGFAGSMGVSKSTGKGSPVLIVCNPKSDDDARYIIYYLRSLALNDVFIALATGIRERSCDLRWNKISVLPFVRPTFGEQKRIADFIDLKSEEIDSLIGLQEQMIEKLKAYKQSVITEAVTKGLNPNAKLVPSGIDWIGEIPEGVKLVKLSMITSKIGSGSTPRGGSSIYVKEGIKFLRSQNVYCEGFDLSDVAYITEEIDEEMSGTRVRIGDVLLNITGGSIGRCYYVDETLGRANVNQHVSIIRPTKIETKYLKYYLQSECGQLQIALLQTGGNREGLSAAALSQFTIIYPLKEEQHAIASYLDEKCSEIDKLIAVKQQKIEKLKDYKKSVIYEAVFGKLDLRDS